MLSHGPLLSELVRLEEQVSAHLDTIDRQADLIAKLQGDRRGSNPRCGCHIPECLPLHHGHHDVA